LENVSFKEEITNSGLSHIPFGIMMKTFLTLDELIKDNELPIKLSIPDTIMSSFDE
jgi:hypothetical protein